MVPQKLVLLQGGSKNKKSSCR